MKYSPRLHNNAWCACVTCVSSGSSSSSAGWRPVKDAWHKTESHTHTGHIIPHLTPHPTLSHISPCTHPTLPHIKPYVPHPLPYTAPAHTHPTYILTLISSGSKCNAKAVCFLVARVHISGTNSHGLSNKSESCAMLYKPTVTTDCRRRRGVCVSIVMPVCLYVCL